MRAISAVGINKILPAIKGINAKAKKMTAAGIDRISTRKVCKNGFP
jgi:hypothetical protein